MKRIGILIGAIVALAAGAASAAERGAAARGPRAEPAQPAAPAAPQAAAVPVAAGHAQTLSTEAIIAIIRKRTPGQQMNAQPDGANYKVRWKATNGRLIDYVVDPASGAILSADGE